MNKRLQEIIQYKTGGRQKDFAELMGWTPQYVFKLLKGENFGLSPDVETPEKPLIQVILRSLSSSVFQASNKFATNLSENRVSDLISGTKIVIFGEF